MPTAVTHHVFIDDQGVARVAGTPFKVLLLIEAWKGGASTPEKLRESYPQLTLAQVHSVLSYYYDNQASVDAEIERRRAAAEAARESAPESPGRQKLRDLGLRP